jgi:hypothetical protein
MGHSGSAGWAWCEKRSIFFPNEARLVLIEKWNDFLYSKFSRFKMDFELKFKEAYKV